MFPLEIFLEEKNQVEGTRRKCAPDAVDLLKLLPWPGTGPRTYLHRVFIMAGEVGLQGPAPETETMQITQSTTTIQAHNNTPSITVPLGTPLSVAARELILSTLRHCGGERKRTAEMLGICTKTLYNRLREYGIREEHRQEYGEPTRQ